MSTLCHSCGGLNTIVDDGHCTRCGDPRPYFLILNPHETQALFPANT